MQIRFKKFLSAGSTPEGQPYSGGVDFDVEDGEEKRGFWLLLPVSAEHVVLSALKARSPDGQTVLRTALIRYGVRHIEQGIRLGLIDFGPGGFAAAMVEDTDDLVRLVATAKGCDYQAPAGRDLHCTAQRGGPPTMVSRPMCNACLIPDRRDLCAALTHPSVTVDFLIDGDSSLTCSALCNEDREEVAEPGNCRVGGHECAYRIVERAESESRSDLSPDQLPEMLDFLDASWRLAFGKTNSLLRLKTATGPATLSKACRTRGDFVAATSALDDLFKSMTVADDLLSAADKAKDENKGDKTLNRITAVLRAAVRDPADLESGLAALKRIRSLNDLRQAFQHGGKAQNLAGSLEAFGLEITPD